jgi:adenylyltransferase/sulfurtransferase
VVAKAMQNATVIVVGCGPVGTTVALHLAKAGVARLLVADDGEIAAAEIAVSPLLGPSAVGRLRSEVVRELCRSAGAIGVDTVPSPVPTDLVVTADLLVIEGRDASGIPLADEADAALSAGVPFLIHSQDALEAFVGPHVRSDGDPCHRCAETRRLGHVDNLDEFMEYRRLRAEQSPLSDCFLSAHASLMAGLISTEILRILVGAPHLSDRSVAVVDLATLNIERSEVLAVPGCPACATAAGTTEQIEIPDPPVAAGSPGVGS